MPPLFLIGSGLTRTRSVWAQTAVVLALCSLLPVYAAKHRPPSPAADPYDQAGRLRAQLEARPEHERTRRAYEPVLAAYRSVYHAMPAALHADASVNAVAELLQEEGRIFHDRQDSIDAIREYELLRRQYPASRERPRALFAEAEIYARDIGDPSAARATLKDFLRTYTDDALTPTARTELKSLSASQRPARASSHHNAVLDAAIASQPPAAAPRRSTRPPTAMVSATPGVIERDLAPAPAYAPSLPGATTAPTPVAARGTLPMITGVRHWSTAVYTRVAIDLDTGSEVRYEASRAPNPDRIFFDLHGVRLAPELIGKAVAVTDGGYLKRIRAAQFTGEVVRVVLDVSDVSEYSAFFLPNPSRLIIDIHGKAPEGALMVANGRPAAVPGTPLASTATPQTPLNSQARPAAPAPGAPQQASATPSPAHTRGHSTPASKHPAADPLGDIATLDRQPNTVHATPSPTSAPVAASVANTTPAPQPGTVLAPAPDLTSHRTHAAEVKAARARGITPADTPAPAIHAPEVAAGSIHAAAPTATGERSMVRALGLKIGRIVVDAGHGGHDSGTLGPGGIEEKEVVLDVALRLGRLLKQRLRADVIYTRDDDTFIPLETRTAIANKAQADLFISVHANSSQDASARGVETYYLNFTSSADALEVAARENAVSDQSIHQLSDLVKKITLQDKISESREFAGDVEQSLYAGLEAGNAGLKDRGVKKAPFVVLIGANMPSILAEISFLTNPDDAHQLRDPEYRQRIAESLYRGVAKYIGSLSGVRLAESAGSPAGQ